MIWSHVLIIVHRWGQQKKKKKKINLKKILKTLGQVSTFLQEPKTLKNCDVVGSKFFFGNKVMVDFR